MSTIFISHSSRNNAAAAQMREWLQRQGYASLFLDFDPADGIPPGRNWERELYQQLRACRAVIVLCDPDSMASDWCFAELTHARALGKHIFPVVVAPCTLRQQLAELQAIDFTVDPEQGCERLRRALSIAGLDLEGAFKWQPGRPPYPGLMAFGKADAAVFFGRDPDIRAALDMLNRLRRFGGGRLALFLGASGSGKSSLVRAGVLPRLDRDADAWRVIEPFRPLHRPLDELAAVLAEASNGKLQRHQIRDRLDTDANPLLDLADELRLASGQRNSAVLVTIDQFEELLDPAPNAQTARLLALLAAGVPAGGERLLVAATLRSDFFGDLQNHPALRELPCETVPVGPLSVQGFAQVIEGPAQVAGIELEPGLTQTLLHDSATEDSLPLLAYVLRELWEHYGEDGRITIEEYRDRLGGLEGSIARSAELVIGAEPLDAAREDDLRAAFLSLVRINEEGQAARRSVHWTDLPVSAQPLLERFVKARLLVSGREGEERILEVAHEALFRVWTRLKGWLDEDRDKLRLREGVRRAAAEWQASAAKAELLLHWGSRLEDAETLLLRLRPDALERDYLHTCRRAEDQRRRARRRRRQLLTGSLVAGLIVFAGLAFWAMQERASANDRLAALHWADGVGERESDPLKASHHFVRAAALTRDAAHARNAYLAATLMAGEVRLAAILEHGQALANGEGGAVFGVDAGHVRTWGSDGGSRVWDTRGGSGVELSRTAADANKVLLSPQRRWVTIRRRDGSWQITDSRSAGVRVELPKSPALPAFGAGERSVATWDEQGTLRVFDLEAARQSGEWRHAGVIGGALPSEDGSRILVWDAKGLYWIDSRAGARLAALPAAQVVGAAVAADGSRAVFWRGDGSAAIWPLRSEGAPLELAPRRACGDKGDARAIGARFITGGARLLTWNLGGSGGARVWDTAGGDELAALCQGRRDIRSAVLSRDQARVLTWGDDNTARMWESATGKELLKLWHGDSVRGALFSADESRILTWSDDRRARLWSSRDGHPLSLPMAHGARVRGAAFDPRDALILTWGDDGTARLWRRQGEPRRVETIEHAEPVHAAALAQDGSEILSASGEERVTLWSSSRGRLAEFQMSAGLLGAAFSPDRTRLLVWGADHALRVRRTSDGAALTPPLKHEASEFGVRGAEFSRDAARIVSWGGDDTARVWNAATGDRIAVLAHGHLSGAAFTVDANRVLTWGAGLVQLWAADGARREPLLTLNHPGGYSVEAAATSSDGRWIVTSDSSGAQRLWNVRKPQEPVRLLRQPPGVRGALFSPDGRSIATWSNDASARIWDTGKGEESVSALKHLAPVLGAAFSANDASRLLTWSEDGTAIVWDSGNGQPITAPLRVDDHDQLEAAAIATHGERILAWGGSTTRSWDFSADYDRIARSGALLELATGTRLSSAGELKVFSAEEFKMRRTEVGEAD